MLLSLYYTLRSLGNGSYLVARPTSDDPSGYLLVFREHADALGYINTHSPELCDRFAVETIPSQRLPSLLQRWQLVGVGLVQDPLLPTIEFLSI